MQRRTIDAVELDLRIQRHAVGARPGVDGRGRVTASDLALDGIEGQRLAVALDGAADGTHLAAARQRAAQRLKRDLAAPTLQQSGAERFVGIMSGGADRQRK